MSQWISSCMLSMQAPPVSIFFVILCWATCATPHADLVQKSPAVRSHAAAHDLVTLWWLHPLPRVTAACLCLMTRWSRFKHMNLRISQDLTGHQGSVHSDNTTEEFWSSQLSMTMPFGVPKQQWQCSLHENQLPMGTMNSSLCVENCVESQQCIDNTVKNENGAWTQGSVSTHF